jgi:hypothetical protein
LPAKIAPGEAARFAFSFRAPLAGVRRHEIPIFADGSDQPLAVLRPAIRAKIVPPRIIQIPSLLKLGLLRGESSAREVLVTAMEKADAPRVIEGVTVEPSSLLTARIADVQEHRGFDPQIIRRTYRIVLSPTKSDSAAARNREGMLLLQTTSKTDIGSTRVPLVITLLDPVAVIPPRLKLVADQNGIAPSARLVLMSRTEADLPIRISDYDDSLLDIQTVDDTDAGVTAYKIIPRSPVAGHAKTVIAFVVGDQDAVRIEVPVELDNPTLSKPAKQGVQAQ